MAVLANEICKFGQTLVVSIFGLFYNTLFLNLTSTPASNFIFKASATSCSKREAAEALAHRNIKINFQL